MALTQISTGGVKDNAVTAGKIPANAIGSSEIADDAVDQGAIADEAVDEARLQISNAGTNGQFLQKQSGNTGGLTWAAANEYTHPNHSGEVTSSADGAQTIASNVVDEDNLKISNAGTNGQYLQKQSGNTGGLTWADVTIPPAGNTFTAVANGSIANNKAVKIDADGKVSEIKHVTQSYFSGATTNAWSTTGPAYVKKNIAVKVRDNVIMSIAQASGDNYFEAALIDITSTGTAMNNIMEGGTPAPTHVQASARSSSTAAACQIEDNKVFICWTTSSGVRGVVCTVSSLSMSFGTEVDIVSATCREGWKQLACIYDPDEARVVVAYTPTSDKIHVTPVSISGTTISAGNATTQVHTGDQNGDMDMAYDTNVDKVLLVYSKSTDQRSYIHALTVNASNAITVHTGVAFAGSLSESTNNSVCFDSTNNKLAVAWREVEAGTAKVMANWGTVASNGTITMQNGGDNYTVVHSGTNSGEEVSLQIRHDDYVDQLIIHYKESGSDQQKLKYLNYPTSGNSFTVGSVNTVYGAQLHYPVMDNYRNGLWLLIGQKGHNSGGNIGVLVGTVFQTSQISSNLDNPRRYVGYADQAYTNGQTATIKTYGNTVSTLSGLTIGGGYLVQGDGTVGTGNDSGTLGFSSPRAGTAIGTGTLLIRDPE